MCFTSFVSLSLSYLVFFCYLICTDKKNPQNYLTNNDNYYEKIVFATSLKIQKRFSGLYSLFSAMITNSLACMNLQRKHFTVLFTSLFIFSIFFSFIIYKVKVHENIVFTIKILQKKNL